MSDPCEKGNAIAVAVNEEGANAIDDYDRAHV
jgi:hypothetical protein